MKQRKRDSRMTIRLPKAIRDALAERAKSEDRSMNAQLVVILKEALQ